MRDLNTFYIDKRTLNSGSILVNDAKMAKKIKDVLEQLNISHSVIIVKSSENFYYELQMFRIKRKFFELVSLIKGEFECLKN